MSYACERESSCANMPRGQHWNVYRYVSGVTLTQTHTHNALVNIMVRHNVLRPVRLLRVWISEGLTQANS